ncbi:MAG TPA: SDR family NAD(P)-dependent oxidoreductase [Saprospiraceae bacterium]|nr:SDR family NAD(P)-dependent oxidoreductase [Candidatus Parvibacillus calidus]MBX2935848.1 SDR family NAD(P)-dependent oxidoreductase [Saprospiraceae bacterium]MCO6469461.1 SDR family NAD(P)-dependent oxidoreductase [Saprospiraceae bacterium]HMY84436.1 SDR family NAD(P)-dependent oxidoreductase [Saprospiraceae bacterium]HMZ25104.1 SDR family NAD(P)-dependent oxidoreductase [Saprospiraceae bacterium]
MVKTILLTGATSGIGKATARELSAMGRYRLILTGRRKERLEALKEELIRSDKTEVHVFAFDIRDLNACKVFWDGLPDGLKQIDILINNAGLAKGLSEIHEGSFDHWEQMIDTNIKGLLHMTRLISPGMVERRQGHIINLGSTAGKETYPNGNVYNATKFAVEALTRAMRMDLYKYGIRVSSVSPGAVEETEFALVRFDGDAQRARIYDDYTPLKAKDVAEIIAFILSRPPHVNIQDVLVTSTQQASSMLFDKTGRK